MPDRRVVIAGVTTRALATSAARSGWQVIAVDGFGDLDLRAVAAEVVVVRGGAQGCSAELDQTLRADYVAYTSNFENHPDCVALLMSGRRLLGNSPEVLATVRDPVGLMQAFRNHEFRTPETRGTAPSGGAGQWLLKPRRSGGGHGTRGWRRGQRVPRTHYLQQRIEGIPGSIVFVSDGTRTLPLAISRQLVGERRLGARGFRYCGSLLAPDRHIALFPQREQLEITASALAEAATREFKLVGLNGIDFIARHGVPYPIEINPRYSASMELVERELGIPLFELHANACQGKLPRRVSSARHPPRVVGKAVLFARRNVTVGNTRGWLLMDAIADVPHSGELIARGRPICTVFGAGTSVEGCRRRLLRRADWVYRSVQPRARGAA
jgi:uncharacterized protein